MSDDWLDAFTEADLDDPELKALDAAVVRVLAEVPAAPIAAPPRRWPWVAVTVCAVAAAALIWTLATPTVSAPIDEGAAVVESVAPAPVRALEPTPVPAAPAAPATVPRVKAPATAPTGSQVEPEPELPALSMLPGLAMDGAEVRIDAQVAVLTSGRLGFLHDAGHDPGVGSVRLAALPIEIRPTGTSFQVFARGQVAAVRLDSGAASLVHESETVVAPLAIGQEVALIPDIDDPLGVRLLYTGEVPLDQVFARVPTDCLCHPEDVVAAVATLRLTPKAGQ